MIAAAGLLAWAAANDLDQRRDTTKAEFCLLASAVGLPLIVQISDPLIAAQAHLFQPALPRPADTSLPAGHFETPWTLAALNGQDYPAILQPDDHPIIAAHRVFWSTGFGDSPKRMPQAATTLRGHLANSTDADEIGLLLLGLYCCRDKIKVTDTAWLDQALPETLAWATYHPHLVAALLIARLADV